MSSLHRKQIASNYEEATTAPDLVSLHKKINSQTRNKRPLKLHFRDLSAVTARG